jgi:hypothetical protein
MNKLVPSRGTMNQDQYNEMLARKIRLIEKRITYLQRELTFLKKTNLLIETHPIVNPYKKPKQLEMFG